MMRYSHRRVLYNSENEWIQSQCEWMNLRNVMFSGKKKASKKDNCWLEVHSFKFIKFKNMQNQATHWLGI